MAHMNNIELKKALKWRKERDNLWTVKYNTGFATGHTGTTDNAKAIARAEDLDLAAKARGNYGMTLSEALAELKKAAFNQLHEAGTWSQRASEE